MSNTKELAKKEIKEAINEMSKMLGLTLTLCSVQVTDTDISFQVGMSGNVKKWLDENVEQEVTTVNNNLVNGATNG